MKHPENLDDIIKMYGGMSEKCNDDGTVSYKNLAKRIQKLNTTIDIYTSVIEQQEKRITELYNIVSILVCKVMIPDEDEKKRILRDISVSWNNGNRISGIKQ